jgi:hypothetical protein
MILGLLSSGDIKLNSSLPVLCISCLAWVPPRKATASADPRREWTVLRISGYTSRCDSTEAIWEIVATCDVRLLYDIAHARCAAHNLTIEDREYLRSLPLASVTEIPERNDIAELEAQLQELNRRAEES